jgi:predicted cupin superfamily sugar epimerase
MTPSNLSSADLIQSLQLQPHPEGGFYRETYRAKGAISQSALPQGFRGNRNFSTLIYYLLPAGAQSKLHRLVSDEQWHFYLGGPMTVVQISPDGKLESILLGTDLKSGQALQHVVPAGFWFGAFPNPGTQYSLVGCAVAPGFDFADFELGNRKDLLAQFPHLKDLIERLGH